MRRYPAGAARGRAAANEEAGLAYNPHPERVPNTPPGAGADRVGARPGGPRRDARAGDGRLLDGGARHRAAGRAGAWWPTWGSTPTRPRAEVEAGAFRAVVDASTQTAQRHGITGVPAFVLDGRLLVSGAQPHEVFERALEQAGVMRDKDGAPEA